MKLKNYMEKYFFFIVLFLLLGVYGCQKQSRTYRMYKDAPQTHAPLKIITRKESKRGLFSSNKPNKKKFHKDSPNTNKKVEDKKTSENKKDMKNGKE